MGMVTRWLRYTQAWTCERTTKAHEEQSSGVRTLPMPVVPAGMAGPAQWVGRESNRVHYSFHRRLDAPVPGNHPCHHPATKALALAGLDSISPNARTVRVLLRLSAFPDLHLARQVLRPFRDREGC